VGAAQHVLDRQDGKQVDVWQWEWVSLPLIAECGFGAHAVLVEAAFYACFPSLFLFVIFLFFFSFLFCEGGGVHFH